MNETSDIERKAETMHSRPPTRTRARALKLGQAASELIRRGSAEKLPLTQIDGVWAIDLPPSAAPLSARRVQQMLDESA